MLKRALVSGAMTMKTEGHGTASDQFPMDLSVVGSGSLFKLSKKSKFIPRKETLGINCDELSMKNLTQVKSTERTPAEIQDSAEDVI